jgi:hypothetical protein
MVTLDPSRFRRVAQGRRQIAAHGLGRQGPQRTAQLGAEQFLEIGWTIGVDAMM